MNEYKSIIEGLQVRQLALTQIIIEIIEHYNIDLNFEKVRSTNRVMYLEIMSIKKEINKCS